MSHDLRRVYRLHERLVNLRSDYNLRLKSAVTISQATVFQSVQQTTLKVRPDLDDKTLRYVQDLLSWVEENQQRIDEAQWGSDLPNVESQLGSHRGLHQTVEDFRSKIERARADEVQLIKPLRSFSHCWIVLLLVFEKYPFSFCSVLQTQLSPVGKGTYKEYLGKLDLQYGKLLVRSKFKMVWYFTAKLERKELCQDWTQQSLFTILIVIQTKNHSLEENCHKKILADQIVKMKKKKKTYNTGPDGMTMKQDNLPHTLTACKTRSSRIIKQDGKRTREGQVNRISK